MRRLNPTVTAQLHAEAATSISVAAVSAHPREAGGLLLGWWQSTNPRVVVRYAVEVGDPDATTSSWTREEELAQRVLQTVRDDLRHPWLGYVGDWHSHPAAAEPSIQDDRSIRRASRQYAMPLLLVVRRSDGTLDWRGARHGKICRVVVTSVDAPDNTDQADERGRVTKENP